MKESFIFYNSFYKSIKELPAESQLQVYNAISEYALYGNEIELDGISKAIFLLIKPQIDANNRRYENGKKGGRPKKDIPEKNEKKPKKNLNETKTKPNVNVNVNDNVNDNDNNIYTPFDKSAGDVVTKSDTVKASKPLKHKYGKYKNVLLKDEELQALKDNFKNYQELIDFLDEYIERKGYKAKSHYLCLRGWVLDAVKRNSVKESNLQTFKPSVQQNNYDQRVYTKDDFKNLYANTEVKNDSC